MINVHTVNCYLKENGFPENSGFLIKLHPKTNKPFFHSWDVQGLKKPTANDLSQYVDQVNFDKQSLQVHRARQIEYLPIGDQLDAILKGFDLLRSNGIDLPEELHDVLDHWQNVKVSNKKPSNQ